jgi:hypothetical protein
MKVFSKMNVTCPDELMIKYLVPLITIITKHGKFPLSFSMVEENRHFDSLKQKTTKTGTLSTQQNNTHPICRTSNQVKKPSALSIPIN